MTKPTIYETESFVKIIEMLSDKFKNTQYAIRGTASLTMQGIDMLVDDVDVLSDKDTALLANTLLHDFIVEPVAYKESQKYKSYYGKFKIYGEQVEVYGDWQILDTKGVWSKPFDASARTLLDYKGTPIYVTTIDNELEVFAKMSRWTAFNKIKSNSPQ